MSLAEWVERRILSAGFEVALFRDGQEIQVAGYERQRVPTGFQGSVVFGVFPRVTRFDEVRLMQGPETVEVLRDYGTTLVLPPDSEYAHEIELVVSVAES